MKVLRTSLVLLTFVGASYSSRPVSAACGRGGPPQFCQKTSNKKKTSKKEKQIIVNPYGLGGWQGIYLEGLRLEGRRFSLSNPNGTDSLFPPSANALLTDAASCDTPKTFEVQVKRCTPGARAVSCWVEVTQGKGICGDESKKTAIGVTVVQGYWDDNGDWKNDAKIVTLACNASASPDESQKLSADGAISRCVSDFRFEPDPGSSNKMLTACIRLQRADYCGDGNSHTYVGTNIDVHTGANGVSSDDCKDGRCYEASWSEKGALCVGHSRWTGDQNDFDTLKCSNKVTFAPLPDTPSIKCRDGQRPSTGDLITRSQTNQCGSEPAPCQGADPCPGCGSSPFKAAKPPSAGAGKKP